MFEYIQKIEQHINALDPSAQEALSSSIITRTYQKGDYLLQEGDVCKFSFFIQKGIARKYYLNEGKEITTELFFENDLAVSLQSYTLQNPSHEYIQAIELVTANVTNYHKFQEIKKQHNSLLELDLMLTECYAIWLEERLFRFHALDATERYQLLLKEQPHFIQHIPLTYLASYLGVSLETLSRIRAKI
jgi:CRP-like cAMP-binding protein